MGTMLVLHTRGDIQCESYIVRCGNYRGMLGNGEESVCFLDTLSNVEACF